MISPLIHLIAILGVWCLCQILPKRFGVHVLTLAGVSAVAVFAPVAAAFIGLMVLEAMLMVLVWRRSDRKSNWRKYGVYLLLPNLLFVDLHGWLLAMPVATLAISFSTIRIFMTAKQLLSSRKEIAPGEVYWILPAAFFLPALVIGPVFSGVDLRDQNRAGATEPAGLRDYRMILQGLVLAVLVSPAFGMLADTMDSWKLDRIGLTWVPLFLQLFAAFWGQSLIAEHTTRFFGYRLPVNFDHPWKARTIKEFWARWHRSMAGFVLQYIFLPLNLRGVSPRLATVAAFVFMGVWHNLSIGYLVWGVVHGVLMAYGRDAPDPNPLRRTLTRVGLWGIVISLSWFANYGPFS
jgi:D-alanyl-lipoteichoic acid acyltransferase DltB (MBOAT superfamily)